MGSASGFVAEARTDLGMREYPAGSNHNAITEYYNRHVDRIGNGPWCDMAVTKWGMESGNGDAVGKFAYTVWHAQWFSKRGQWHYGTRGIRKGDVVFFDWTRRRSIGYIDHVGIVEKVSGNTIYTIEGNFRNICQRMARDSTYIVGYGRPAFSGGAGTASWMAAVIKDLPLLKKGADGEHVQSAQGLLLARSHPEIEIDGRFDDEMERAVKAVQQWGKVTADGEIGPKTWPVLLRLVSGMTELPLLKKGDDGEAVQTCQGLLRARSHPEVVIDGDYGPITERAVQAVQRWGGVLTDGEVGPKTWPVLLRVHR